MSLLFSRNTKVYIEKDSRIWEVPVLDGFSFSQGTNNTEVTLNEAVDTNGKSKRSRKLFNDSYAPAEWSLSTYIRPFASVPGANDGWQASGNNADIHAVEEVLWACLVSKPTFTPSVASTSDASWSKGIINETGSMTVGFKDSEIPDLGTFNLYFESPTTGGGLKRYKLTGCCVNEASVDFDIDGIATINWSGFSKTLEDDGGSSLSGTYIKEKISDTNNFIRNRLTSMTLSSSISGSSLSYQAVLTGGNITFTNNLTFLTPETIGKINQPTAHVVGTRGISGSFSCYLDSGAVGANQGNVADLFEDIIDANQVITNSFDMDISIGGGSGNRVEVSLPRCHLEIPTHSIDDVISLEVNFHALSDGLDPTDGGNNDSMEAKLVYKV